MEEWYNNVLQKHTDKSCKNNISCIKSIIVRCWDLRKQIPDNAAWCNSILNQVAFERMLSTNLDAHLERIVNNTYLLKFHNLSKSITLCKVMSFEWLFKTIKCQTFQRAVLFSVNLKQQHSLSKTAVISQPGQEKYRNELYCKKNHKSLDNRTQEGSGST